MTIVIRRKDRRESRSKMGKKLRKAFIVFVLAIMFGIGWAFGILGSENRNAVSVIFQILFVVIVGFQGLFIFLLYPCRTKDARDQWKRLFYSVTCCRHGRDEQSKSSVPQVHNSPNKHNSSTSLKTLTFTKSSSIDYSHPSSNDSTGFMNVAFSPSPIVQNVNVKELKVKSTMQASVFAAIEEEPTTPVGPYQFPQKAGIEGEIPIPCLENVKF